MFLQFQFTSFYSLFVVVYFSRFNRTKIRWSKNAKFLGKTKKNVKLSRKGALRILDVSYRDSGVYACHAGLSVSELRLRVKPKPGDREPTPTDYESIEDEGEDDGEGGEDDDIDIGDIDEDDDEALIETEGKVFQNLARALYFMFEVYF